MKNILVFCISVITLHCLVGCTDVELCNITQHPHAAPVSFSFNWGGKKDIPDSMYVIANRVINTRKYSMVVSSKTNGGHFVYNPDYAEADSVENRGNFALHTGYYRFLAFPHSNTDLVYINVDSFMKDKKAETKLSDLSIEYKTYKKGDQALKCNLPKWDDYNPYADFIPSGIKPVVYDSIPNVDIDDIRSHTIIFAPRNLTQNIEINFNINKDISKHGFVIDSVTAEISGIPRAINLANAYIDITRTAKMMFKMDLVDGTGRTITDKSDNKSLCAHANLNLTSIVRSASPSEKTGPGIMQVILHARAVVNSGKPDEKIIKKNFQGKINLYNTLSTANLIEIVNNGKNARRRIDNAVLNVVTNLVIDGDRIVDTATNDDGIDRWVNCESIIVDI